MLNNKVECKYIRKVELNELTRLIIRGGWPENLDKRIDYIDIIPKSYINSIINKDINERKDKKRILTK